MTSDTIVKRIGAVADRLGQRRALTFLRDGQPETSLTYARLKGEINRCAQFFIQRGIVKGDRVILLADKCLFGVVAHFALYTCLLAGARARMLDRFDAGAVLAELSGEAGHGPCSVFMAVPTM